MSTVPSTRRPLPPFSVKAALPGIMAAVVLLWTYGPTLLAMAHRWGHDSRYSHGYLVPLFSIYLLWVRRERLDSSASWQPNWWGLLPLLGGLGLNALGTYLFYEWINALSLVPCICGLVILLGGRPALAWSWPAAAFLLFMMPLPYRLETGLANPLQRVGTIISTYALQTFGFAAFAEGNIIRMGEVRLNVVEACSGLSMLMTFFALCTAAAIVLRRPLWERLLIVASAVPIAVAANVCRITVTGVMHKVAGPKLADLVFHTLAGFLMMPLGLVFLWAELRLVAWLLIPRPIRGEVAATFDFGLSAHPAPAMTKRPGSATPKAGPALSPAKNGLGF